MPSAVTELAAIVAPSCPKVRSPATGAARAVPSACATSTTTVNPEAVGCAITPPAGVSIAACVVVTARIVIVELALQLPPTATVAVPATKPLKSAPAKVYV